MLASIFIALVIMGIVCVIAGIFINVADRGRTSAAMALEGIGLVLLIAGALSAFNIEEKSCNPVINQTVTFENATNYTNYIACETVQTRDVGTAGVLGLLAFFVILIIILQSINLASGEIE